MAEIEWLAEKILGRISAVSEKTSKEVAKDVMKDAKDILKRKAKTTTELGLLSQFYIEKSKFKDGGYLVWSQGPKKWRKPYHASFVEMGTFKDEPKPYMRPAVSKKKQRKAQDTYQKNLDKELAKE